MNLHRPFALSLALVTLLGLTAAGASAETVLKGSFELPQQVYWGSTLLPAGQYTLLLNKEASGVRLFSVRGDSVNATFIAPAGAQESSGSSKLKIDEINGAYVVREMDSSTLGMAYRFPVSKAIRTGVLTGNAAQPVSIPVVSASGF